MKSIIIFISGCVVGVVATLLVLFVISIGIRQNATDSESSFYERTAEIQYIEIRG
ncbi:MAG: hypothetical protein M0R38_07635 [Bacteroidia bacterium]|nr:hypothetical protein [Bacteroidia bacterium]